MSTRTITYQVCNGCYRDTLNDGVEIVRSEARHANPDLPGTVDICFECAGTKYICRYCRQVHGDDDACEMMKHLMGQDEPAPEGW